MGHEAAEATNESSFVPVSIVPAEGRADGIRLGITQLAVPAEKIGEDEVGEDLDFSSEMTPPIRRPERMEWFDFDPSLVHETRLLVVQSGPGGYETKYYFVTPSLRGAIHEQIRDVQAFLIWSHRDKRWVIWVVHVNVENLWYQSLAPFLTQPAAFYAGKKFRVESDRRNGRYRVRCLDVPETVKVPARPGRSISELLGAALGPRGFITSADHPVYQELIQGEEVC